MEWLGEQTVKVPTSDNKGLDVNFKYTTQLGDINSVVGNASLINAQTGKPLPGTGTQSMRSGVISVVPVYKGTNIPYPIKKGDDQTMLVADDVIEFKSMVFGKASTGEGALKQEVDVWAPSSAVAKNTGESKTMNKTQVADYAYTKKAEETTAEYKAKGLAKKNKGNTKSEYKLNGKTYKLSQIEKAAKQSGVTVDEYIKSVGLK